MVTISGFGFESFRVEGHEMEVTGKLRFRTFE